MTAARKPPAGMTTLLAAPVDEEEPRPVTVAEPDALAVPEALVARVVESPVAAAAVELTLDWVAAAAELEARMGAAALQ